MWERGGGGIVGVLDEGDEGGRGFVYNLFYGILGGMICIQFFGI